MPTETEIACPLALLQCIIGMGCSCWDMDIAL